MRVSYAMVAAARGQKVLWYREFGSYQGEWLLLSCDDTLFYLYKGHFGSCSGCDSLQATFSGFEVDPADPEVQEFIKGYTSYLEMRRASALKLAREDGGILRVLPGNSKRWDQYSDIDVDAAAEQVSLAILAEMGEIHAGEIVRIDNLEGRRLAIERYGADRWVDELGGETLDVDGENSLHRVELDGQPFVFMHLKDSSTERRYVLRVPPETETVHEGRAWSFDIPAEQFVLSAET